MAAQCIGVTKRLGFWEKRKKISEKILLSLNPSKIQVGPALVLAQSCILYT